MPLRAGRWEEEQGHSPSMSSPPPPHENRAQAQARSPTPDSVCFFLSPSSHKKMMRLLGGLASPRSRRVSPPTASQAKCSQRQNFA